MITDRERLSWVKRKTAPETWATRLLLGSMIAMVGWTSQRILAHEIWMAKAETSHYTFADAVRDKDVMITELGKIRAELSLIREKILLLPTEVPPKWFLEEVKEIKSRVNTIERKKTVEND